MSYLGTAALLACREIYPPISDKSFRKIYTSGDTVCGTRLLDGIFYIALQGTTNFDGWRADFDCSLYEHPILGGLHNGFYDNLPNLIKKLLPEIPLGFPIVCTGHSKGAAEAALLSAELHLLKLPIKKCVMFASPKPGDEKFSIWMRENIPGVSYRNSTLQGLWGDPIPLLPGDPYRQVYKEISFTKPPKKFIDLLIPTQWHQADLYYTHGILS